MLFVGRGKIKIDKVIDEANDTVCSANPQKKYGSGWKLTVTYAREQRSTRK